MKENYGKKLSYLLRHDNDALKQGKIDRYGWREVSELISEHGYSPELIDEIVRTNDKKRYEYNSDKTKIRARQGHSINVDVELKQCIPPYILYHGTSESALKYIYELGIIKCKRLFVHLSKDKETALKVGSRYGKPHVLTIDAKRMHDDGIAFYLSNNGVWLTDYVNPKYIIKEEED